MTARVGAGVLALFVGLVACGRAGTPKRPAKPSPAPAPPAAMPAAASHVYHWDTEVSLEDVDTTAPGGAYRAAENEYQVACARVALREQLVSPIDAFVDRVERDERAVYVGLDAEAGTPEHVLARLHCHRAFLALAGLENVPDSPLAVRGLVVELRARQDGVEVALVPRDPALLGELERRARAALERRRR